MSQQKLPLRADFPRRGSVLFYLVFLHHAVVGGDQAFSNVVELFCLLVAVDQWALLQLLVSAAFAVGKLEQDWGDDGGDHHHDDDRGEKDVRHQAEGGALVGDDQRDLAAADHADAHLLTLPALESAQLGAQSAADNLGQHRDQCQQDRKDDDPAVHLRQLDL